jgi:hypothetical protein
MLAKAAIVESPHLAKQAGGVCRCWTWLNWRPGPCMHTYNTASFMKRTPGYRLFFSLTKVIKKNRQTTLWLTSSVSPPATKHQSQTWHLLAHCAFTTNQVITPDMPSLPWLAARSLVGQPSRFHGMAATEAQRIHAAGCEPGRPQNQEHPTARSARDNCRRSKTRGSHGLTRVRLSPPVSASLPYVVRRAEASDELSCP